MRLIFCFVLFFSLTAFSFSCFCVFFRSRHLNFRRGTMPRLGRGFSVREYIYRFSPLYVIFFFGKIALPHPTCHFFPLLNEGLVDFYEQPPPRFKGQKVLLPLPPFWPPSSHSKPHDLQPFPGPTEFGINALPFIPSFSSGSQPPGEFYFFPRLSEA